jgi:hypothetical protein
MERHCEGCDCERRETRARELSRAKVIVAMDKSEGSAFQSVAYRIRAELVVSKALARDIITRADTENDICTIFDQALRARFDKPADSDVERESMG